ncbi:MAG TPA: acido-empty-quinoprotein group A, partial [Vicinamibacterales bacterium]|nr:acido-empty-quinoprotein group A [Vicinamibacterales bacterium]
RHRVSGDTEMRNATAATLAKTAHHTRAANLAKFVKTFFLFAAFAAFAFRVTFAAGDGLDPSKLLKPLGEEWTSYSGDYSGKRYSSLTQINQSNVRNLTLAWMKKLSGPPSLTGGGGRRGGGSGAPASETMIGGEGSGDVVVADQMSVKGSILQVNGVLYVTAPDHVWALGAHDGHELWHYFWKTKGGTHIGNRGAGMWNNYLFVETPDNYLVSLDARTGKERWHKEIASFQQQYFSTAAPVVVGNHVLVGTGNDLDAPGFLQSFDPETGAVQWKFYAVPMNQGDPGLETWKSLDAARHGGGQMWIPGSYDPETHLYIVGTGNPTPAYTSQTRGEGENLFTCSIVAINVDTGKMAWYYQTSPHDTHDWDSAQTPVLVDGDFKGNRRKLVLTASRNGYYFTLDRTTGEHLVSSRFSDTVNWAKPEFNKLGQPVRDPAKDYHVAGALVSSANGGATNWPPPSFSPDTGLLYVPTAETWAMYYLTETDPRGAMGLGGKEEIGLNSSATFMTAIDYTTGKIVWKHRYRTASNARAASGVLTTAGKLLLGGDPSGNLVAFDPANGRILWHSQIGQVTNAPQTYMVDGRQYVLAAAGDTLFAFALYQ